MKNIVLAIIFILTVLISCQKKNETTNPTPPQPTNTITQTSINTVTIETVSTVS